MGITLETTDLTATTLKDQDCVVIITDHKDMSIEKIVSNSSLIVDTRNATRGYSESHIVKL